MCCLGWEQESCQVPDGVQAESLHSGVHCGTGMQGFPPQQLSVMNAIRAFIVANCATYIRKRPSWRGAIRFARVSSFRWKESEEGGIFNCSLILLAAMP